MSGPSILTATGQYFYFNKPEEHQYDIEEIAHALSHTCRYTGHCKRFYSVAQHSVLVAMVLPPEFRFQGLMHDASEAYLGDVASPLKGLLPEYKALEHRVEQAISDHFGLPFPLHPAVKNADLRMLMTEKRDIMLQTGQCQKEWPDIEPYKFKIRPCEPEVSKAMFLDMYTNLKGE